MKKVSGQIKNNQFGIKIYHKLLKIYPQLTSKSKQKKKIINPIDNQHYLEKIKFKKV